jgi:hypothetical protein
LIASLAKLAVSNGSFRSLRCSPSGVLICPLSEVHGRIL